WRIAGFGLGAATALMGEKAAHACTEAVEEVIEKHYARQSEALEGVDEELKDVVDRFREDELAHRDTAVGQGAHGAPGYPVLSARIKCACRAAIRISEKIGAPRRACASPRQARMPPLPTCCMPRSPMRPGSIIGCARARRRSGRGGASSRRRWRMRSTP